jgi:hypothetical protein
MEGKMGMACEWEWIRGLITIGGIGKMYDNRYIGFNFNFDHMRNVEAEEWKGVRIFRGYIRARTWESVHHVFITEECPLLHTMSRSLAI